MIKKFLENIKKKKQLAKNKNKEKEIKSQAKKENLDNQLFF